MSIWTRLRDILVGAPEPPPPSPQAKRPTGAEAPRGSQFQHLPDPSAPPAPTMKWHQERYGPKVRGSGWTRRVSTRQRVLVGLAAVALLAMTVAFFAKLAIDRRLPTAVQGLYRGESAAYADHYVELRGRMVAWTTGDSAQPTSVQQIARVRRTPHTHGVLYRIEYVEDGTTFELAVVHDTARPDVLTFANLMAVPWRRVRTNRSLIPTL